VTSLERLAASRPAPGPRVADRPATWLGLLIIYGATAVWLTYPGSTQLSTHMLGIPSDAFQNLWNILWVQGWLAGHHALYFTHLEFAPRGANLAWETLSLPGTIVAAAIRPLVGLDAAYNSVLLAALSADGLAGYAFARKLGLTRLGAAVAGLTFMTSPYFVGQLLGHLHMVSAFGVPLFLGALWDLGHRPDGPLARYLLAGFYLALTMYSAQDYALYAVAAGVGLLLFHPAHPFQRLRTTWTGWAALAGVFAVLVAPLVYNMLWAPLAVHNAAATPLTTPWVVDVEGLVLPDPWGVFAGLATSWRLAPDLMDGGIFPGFMLWAGAITVLGMRRQASLAQRRTVAMAAVLTGVFALLSLGPYLHAGGTRLNLPLPDWILASLPFWKDTWPERLAMLTALFGSILAGVAVELARHQLARHQLGWAVLAPVVLGLIMLGSWAEPFPATRPPRVPYVHLVRQAGGSVLFVPAVVPSTAIGYGPFAFIYVAARLDVPTPEGYVSRLPTSTIRQINRSLVLRYLWGTQFSPNPEHSLADRARRDLAAYLTRHDIKSILFLDTRSDPIPRTGALWLRRVLGPHWRAHPYGATVLFTWHPGRQ